MQGRFSVSFVATKLRRRTQLKGVVVSGNPAESVAILAANGKPAKSVRTNEEIMPGVTVKEVQRNFVLLSEGGTVKRVELPEKAKKPAK